MIAVEVTPNADAPTVDVIVARVWGIVHTAALSDSYQAALVAALALPGNILADTPDGRWACIVQTCCVTAGGRGEDAIPAAAAAEFFMVALDVLDDEEDGEATPLRTAWGAARALNVSTGLIFLAQRALLAAPGGALLLGIVLDAGIHACAGQHADLAPAAEHGGDPTSALSVAKGKSASLVAALCQVGAACAEADAGTQSLYACFGASLGMTLQLRNDIAAARPGATQKTDIALGRPTLPPCGGEPHGRRPDRGRGRPARRAPDGRTGPADLDDLRIIPPARVGSRAGPLRRPGRSRRARAAAPTVRGMRGSQERWRQHAG